MSFLEIRGFFSRCGRSARIVVDPHVGHVRDFVDEWQVIATKAGRILPRGTIFIDISIAVEN